MSFATEHDPCPDGRRARDLFGAAFMSDTKWRKLFEAVGQALPDVRLARVKFVDAGEARQMRFPPSVDCPHAYMDTVEFGPTELRAIEWLEFDADISRPLAAIGHFPLKVSEGRTRVTGYGDPRPENLR